MEYKNDLSSINAATVNYILQREIYIFSTFVIALLPIWIVSYSNRNLFPFKVTLIAGGAALLLGIFSRIIIFRNRYKSFKLKIANRDISILIGKSQEHFDVEQISCVRKDQTGAMTIHTNENKEFQISQFVEKSGEIENFFSEHIQNGPKQKNLTMISFIPLIFYGALFLARYIPTHWYYVIVGFGFLITSSYAIILLIRNQPKKIGTWVTVAFEGFLFYVVSEKILFLIELLLGNQ